MLSQNYKACIVPGSGGFGRSIGNPLCSEWGSGSHEGQRFGKLGISGCDWGIWKKTQIDLLYWGCVTQHYFDNSFFFVVGARCLSAGRTETPEWTSRGFEPHRQSVSAARPTPYQLSHRVAYNIISTTQWVKKGWSVIQSP